MGDLVVRPLSYPVHRPNRLVLEHYASFWHYGGGRHQPARIDISALKFPTEMTRVRFEPDIWALKKVALRHVVVGSRQVALSLLSVAPREPPE